MYTYFPALRFKQGEYRALSKMPVDLLNNIEPRFIVPPSNEIDPELGRKPTKDEIGHISGERIGKHWPFRRAFLDTQFIAEDVGDDGLRKLFARARSYNANIVPVATLLDLHKPLYRDLQCPGGLKMALIVAYEGIDGDEIKAALETANLQASDCVFFLDFTGAPLDPEIASGSIGGIIELVNEIGKWQKIVFQASNFPTKNTADHGSDKHIDRAEWKAFHSAMKDCSVSPNRIGYGDFGADCAEINFPRGKSGGRAIRHIRYSTPSSTIIFRGEKEGKDAEIMRDVCNRIVESPFYSGQSYSSADDHIFKVANSLVGPGNASMWREWNTIHHLTLVVRELGAMIGETFKRGTITEIGEQLSLLEYEEV